MKTKILSFGEIIWDDYGDKCLIGGAALNFAAHAARCGMDSSLLSAVGSDALGEETLDVVRSLGVNASLIQRSPRETGRCLVTLDKRGLPVYNVLTDTAYDNVILSEEDVAAVRSLAPKALYFGTLIQRSPVSRATLRKLLGKCHFEETVCDVNLRKDCYDKESTALCLESATILKLSDEEEPLLREMDLYACEDGHPSIVRAICDRYPQLKLVILTLGEKGCFVYERVTGEGFYEKPQPTRVASTVGAGDSFLAAFVASYLADHNARAAARLATEVSRFVVSEMGAIPHYMLVNGTITK